MKKLSFLIQLFIYLNITFQLQASGALEAFSPTDLRTLHAGKRYIITYKNSSGAKLIAKTAAHIAVRLDKYNSIAAYLPQPVLENLRSDPNIIGIEEDALRYPYAETTPATLSLVQALAIGEKGADNTTVCVIDSGIQGNHEDLSNLNITTSPDRGTGDPLTDGIGHGTHVTGIIAAIGGNNKGVLGVNPGGRLNIHIVKVFNDEGRYTYSSNIAAAVGRCISERPPGTNLVINMSLGGSGGSRTEEMAFRDAFNAGFLSIAAAGNGGNYQMAYPASYAAVVSVAAIDSNLNRASFSQRNRQVELAAPGVRVLSTYANSDGSSDGYRRMSGTSMATPHVSGVAAKIWSHFPAATNREVRDALQKTAMDRGAAGRDTSFGFGVVQAKAALKALRNSSPTPEPTLNMRLTLDKISYNASDNMIKVTAEFTNELNKPVDQVIIQTKLDDQSIGLSFRQDKPGLYRAKLSLPATGNHRLNVRAIDDRNLKAYGLAEFMVRAAKKTVHVAKIKYLSSVGRQGKENIGILVTIADSKNRVVQSAAVKVDVEIDGDRLGSGSATSNSNGQVGFRVRNAPKGCYKTQVVQLNRDGYEWDRTADYQDPGDQFCR